MTVQDSLFDLRAQIRRATCADEKSVLATLLASSSLSPERRERLRGHAVDLVEHCRRKSHKAGTLDAFLQEFGLSNKEGIALMCLAEALLRVPDEETADRLIAEKIQSGDWGAHKGKSWSRFVNASVWGLMLTGRVVRLDDDITDQTSSWMRRLINTLGEPVVRQAVLSLIWLRYRENAPTVGLIDISLSLRTMRSCVWRWPMSFRASSERPLIRAASPTTTATRSIPW